ncbi:MAG: hypothetical protein SVO01_00020 [Thermotogota bacterium]|nr:hypothetical protein [Thermotogota bacterium]
MTPDENIKHKFNLKGLQIGDVFIGCSNCWFRINPHEAIKMICPDCKHRLSLFIVTKDDIKDL